MSDMEGREPKAAERESLFGPREWMLLVGLVLLGVGLGSALAPGWGAATVGAILTAKAIFPRRMQPPRTPERRKERTP